MTRPELIIALDYPRAEDALALVDMVGDAVSWYKVGLELFVADGSAVIRGLAERGRRVFLDLKFHDIPNTAAGACVSALSHGVQMMNLHVQGGTEMMTESVKRLGDAARDTGVEKPLLIGVTLLTSLDEAHLAEYGITAGNAADYVAELARKAKSAGLDGVVASARETAVIKDACGSDFLTITPGIRPASAAVGDQKRVVTPGDAKRMGTDFMVVGRPVTKASDPLSVVRSIQEETA